METFKNRAVGNRDGLKWKVMSSTLASDARKRADIPKESYTSQRKLVSLQTGMEVRDGDAEIF